MKSILVRHDLRHMRDGAEHFGSIRRPIYGRPLRKICLAPFSFMSGFAFGSGVVDICLMNERLLVSWDVGV
jgi:hypothetical protein